MSCFVVLGSNVLHLVVSYSSVVSDVLLCGVCLLVNLFFYWVLIFVTWRAGGGQGVATAVFVYSRGGRACMLSCGPENPCSSYRLHAKSVIRKS